MCDMLRMKALKGITMYEGGGIVWADHGAPGNVGIKRGVQAS